MPIYSATWIYYQFKKGSGISGLEAFKSLAPYCILISVCSCPLCQALDPVRPIVRNATLPARGCA